MDQLTFLSEEPPASPSPSRDSARDWVTTVATWLSSSLDLLRRFGPVGWSGRMSPASYRHYPTQLPIAVRRTSTWTPVTDPETGKRSWLLIDTNLTKTMRSPVSWPDYQNSGMGGPSEYLTLSSAEFNHTLVPSHSDGDVCSLSDILEPHGENPMANAEPLTVEGVTPIPDPNDPQAIGAYLRRYSLSGRACRGILRRAEKRGRQLPPSLQAALEHVARTTSRPNTATSSPTTPSLPDFQCEKCGETNSATWHPTCEWCGHEQGDPQ